MRLTRRWFAVSAALLMLAPAAAAQQKRAAPDWTRTVVATPEGGFRMGNPAAKVKLVEYGSLTCPHCRHFAETAMVPLKAQVKSGKISFEFRNYILNGVDAAATLVARCGGAPRFFPIVDRLYATQGELIGRINGLTQAQREEWRALPNSQRLAKVAEAGGILKIAASHGVTAAQAGKCLADSAALARLGKMVESGNALGVSGTPTFFVNGVRVEATDWTSLEPHLKRAGG